MSRVKITLKKSPTGHNKTQKRTVRALGLKRLHQTVYQPDTPAIRGMIARIPHLLHVETVQESEMKGDPQPAHKQPLYIQLENKAAAEPNAQNANPPDDETPAEQHEEASS
ncbi:MAG: 50S ribosomal protein L30 [Fimbriimonadales bacterium]|nr:50S ribosomal protein L30 [Fimbriimonadales bacterium]